MAIRILVVDDAAFIRDMMKKHLRERIAGAEIIDAVDGNRAVAMLKQKRVDLILSDWEMPDMNGEQFLHWVRSEEAYKNIPFVMVTSRGDKDHVVKAVQSGVSDYLSKPFTPDDLIKKVIKQLRKIGKEPKVKTDAADSMGHAIGSVDALTGGDGTKIISTTAPAAEQRLQPLNAAPAQTAAKPLPTNKALQAKAQLRFTDVVYDCDVQDISLQALYGTITRQGKPPTVFDPVVLDLFVDNDEEIARINAYVHSVQAAENRVSTKIVKIIIRYVDNDPKKMEVLSRFVGRFRQ